MPQFWLLNTKMPHFWLLDSARPRRSLLPADRPLRIFASEPMEERMLYDKLWEIAGLADWTPMTVEFKVSAVGAHS